MTSRQVQKLSSSGPRRSARPAMARWKAWLCTLATPGTAMPARRSAPGWRRRVGRDGGDRAPLDRDQHVALPAGLEQGVGNVKLRHVGFPCAAPDPRLHRGKGSGAFITGPATTASKKFGYFWNVMRPSGRSLVFAVGVGSGVGAFCSSSSILTRLHPLESSATLSASTRFLSSAKNRPPASCPKGSAAGHAVPPWLSSGVPATGRCGS